MSPIDIRSPIRADQRLSVFPGLRYGLTYIKGYVILHYKGGSRMMSNDMVRVNDMLAWYYYYNFILL